MKNHGPALKSYQSLLMRELEERKARNPLYSLRSFAKHLDLSPALLSLIMSGKQGLTPKSARKIASRLGLSTQEIKKHLTPSSHGAATDRPNPQWDEMNADDFAMIADWYHYGILALAQLPTNQCDADWIAKKLGISKREANVAYRRLRRLGLICEDGQRFKQVAPQITTSTKTPSAAIRKHHRQNLRRAEETLDGVDISERFFSSFTVAIAKNDYDFVCNEIAKFQRKLSGKLSQNPNKDSVYTFGIQFFPSLSSNSTQHKEIH